MYSKVIYRKFNSLRRFGVELELNNDIKKSKLKEIIEANSDIPVKMTNYALNEGKRYWQVKEDATCGPKGVCGPKGFEVASFVGSGIKEIDHISDISDCLKANGVKVNNHCGLHVHVDASDLLVEQVSSIVAKWLKIESWVGYTLPSRRRNNPYCQYMLAEKLNFNRKKKLTAKDFWDKIEPKDTSYFQNRERRYTLNLVNYARGLKSLDCQRSTLELRWPEGSLERSDVANWIILFINFIEYNSKLKMPLNFETCGNIDECLEILGLGHKNEKFVILDKRLFDVKTWFLERMVKSLSEERNKFDDFCTKHDYLYNKHKNPLIKNLINFWGQQALAAKDVLNRMWLPLKKYS